MSRAARSLWLSAGIAAVFSLAVFTLFRLLLPDRNAIAWTLRADGIAILLVWLCGKLGLIRVQPADIERCEPTIRWPNVAMWAVTAAGAAACFAAFRISFDGAALLMAFGGGVVSMVIALMGDLDEMLGSNGMVTMVAAFMSEVTLVVAGTLGVSLLLS